MSEELTFKELVIQKLTSIKEDVSPEDKKAYITEFDSSKSTVSSYLDGTVLDLDRGHEMYLFFKKRIDAKKASLANA